MDEGSFHYSHREEMFDFFLLHGGNALKHIGKKEGGRYENRSFSFLEVMAKRRLSWLKACFLDFLFPDLRFSLLRFFFSSSLLFDRPVSLVLSS